MKNISELLPDEPIPAPLDKEIIFNDAIREWTVLAVLALTLVGVSHIIVGVYRRRDTHTARTPRSLRASPGLLPSPGDDEATVDTIATWVCTFSLSISIGAVLLLPVSIISNEVLVMYSDSQYIRWLNKSLIQGVWNLVFLFSNLSLFVALPFVYLFTEAEGFPGSKKGVRARAVETSVVLLLLVVLVSGVAFILALLLGHYKEHTLRQTIDAWASLYLPFLYSLISCLGVLFLLLCTPVGLGRLFSALKKLIRGGGDAEHATTGNVQFPTGNVQAATGNTLFPSNIYSNSTGSNSDVNAARYYDQSSTERNCASDGTKRYPGITGVLKDISNYPALMDISNYASTTGGIKNISNYPTTAIKDIYASTGVLKNISHDPSASSWRITRLLHYVLPRGMLQSLLPSRMSEELQVAAFEELSLVRQLRGLAECSTSLIHSSQSTALISSQNTSQLPAQSTSDKLPRSLLQKQVSETQHSTNADRCISSASKIDVKCRDDGAVHRNDDIKSERNENIGNTEEVGKVNVENVTEGSKDSNERNIKTKRSKNLENVRERGLSIGSSTEVSEKLGNLNNSSGSNIPDEGFCDDPTNECCGCSCHDDAPKLGSLDEPVLGSSDVPILVTTDASKLGSSNVSPLDPSNLIEAKSELSANISRLKANLSTTEEMMASDGAKKSRKRKSNSGGKKRVSNKAGNLWAKTEAKSGVKKDDYSEKLVAESSVLFRKSEPIEHRRLFTEQNSITPETSTKFKHVMTPNSTLSITDSNTLYSHPPLTTARFQRPNLLRYSSVPAENFSYERSRLMNRWHAAAQARKRLEIASSRGLVRRCLVYPIGVVLLALVTSLVVLLVLCNTLQLISGLKALPLVVTAVTSRSFPSGTMSSETSGAFYGTSDTSYNEGDYNEEDIPITGGGKRNPSRGSTAKEKTPSGSLLGRRAWLVWALGGPLAAIAEVAVIAYLAAASLVGCYSLPVMKQMRPVVGDTSMVELIINCIVLLVLASALPLLATTLGLTNFDLLGDYGRVGWLGNFWIVLGYNLLFAGAAVWCLAQQCTLALRTEIKDRLMVLGRVLFNKDHQYRVGPEPDQLLPEPDQARPKELNKNAGNVVNNSNNNNKQFTVDNSSSTSTAKYSRSPKKKASLENSSSSTSSNVSNNIKSSTLSINSTTEIRSLLRALSTEVLKRAYLLSTSKSSNLESRVKLD